MKKKQRNSLNKMHKSKQAVLFFCGKSTKSEKTVEKCDFCDNHGLLKA